MTTDTVALTKAFVAKEVNHYLAVPGAEEHFPRELVNTMAKIGLFGLNVSSEYGGAGLGQGAVLAANRELSAGWQSLSALLGTHFRVCLYLSACGTDAQKAEFLPHLARGETLVSHAYHEKGIRDHRNFKTELTRDADGAFRISGVKHWVTNARDADQIVVIARCAGALSPHGTVAAIVSPTDDGVRVSGDITRPGVRGVSLSSVEFAECRLVDEGALVGGLDADVDGFIARFEPGSSLGFCARALGAAEAATRDLAAHLQARDTEASDAEEVVLYRYGQVQTSLYSMQATFEHTAATLSDQPIPSAAAHMAKVYCAEVLQRVVRDCIMLKGGSGYASADNSLDRIYRDAVSLILIDTPNDVLLTRIGKSFAALLAED